MPCEERRQGSHGEPNVLKACQNKNKLALIRLLILRVSPCYGNFDKQSTAPKQPLVTIPSPMVMLIFVAQNTQVYY